MKKFLIGVADVRLYADEQCTSLVASSKTMLNNTVDITNSAVDIQGGKGNKLQKRFFTSAMMNLTLTDCRFDLGMIAANVGSEIASSFTVRKEMNVTLNNYVGTLTGVTPVGVNGGAAVGYVEYDGEIFGEGIALATAGDNYTITVPQSWGIPANASVCVSFNAIDDSARYITVPANIIPKVVYAVLEADLASDEAGEGVIGRATVVVPRLQLSGTQSLALTSDGYAQQEITGSALAFTPSGTAQPCGSKEIYGYIVEELKNATWYSDVKALIVSDLKGASGDAIPVVVYAFNGQYSFLLTSKQLDDLTVTGSDGVTYTKATHTVSATKAGTITAKVTSKPELVGVGNITIG